MFFQPGDVVWVQVGQDSSHEEPATVLKTGCTFEEERSGSGSGNSGEDGYGDAIGGGSSSSSSSSSSVVVRSDGVMVQYRVSLMKAIHPPREIRALLDDDQDDNNDINTVSGGGNKRKTRSSRRQQVAATKQKEEETAEEEEEEEEAPPLAPAASAGRKRGSTTSTTNTASSGSRRRSARSAVTPSPRNASSAAAAAAAAARKSSESDGEDPKDSCDDDTNYSEEEEDSYDDEEEMKEEDEEESSVSDKKKPPAKRKRGARSRGGGGAGTKSTSTAAQKTKKKPPPRANRKKRQIEEDESEEEEEVEEAAVATSSPHFKRRSSKTNKPSMKEPAGGGKRGPPAAKKPKIVVAAVEAPPAAAAAAAARGADPPADDVGNSGGDDDDDDESDDDRPFVVEYAATGRSTCRRCDQPISKGDVRVSHQPLFRGKPGFRVYRHLECAIFSEEVQSASDVGGYRKLSAEDRERLSARVEASKVELEQENREIQPDELVPVTFQGEIRPPPPGLVGTLLPFQVEGHSWMYCQEVNVPDIRGGILADEMGMGKTIQTIVTMLDNKPKLQHALPGAKHPPSAPDLDERKKEEALWNTSVEEWKHEMGMINVPKKMWPRKKKHARAGTLVVCPVIALSQWRSEILKFTEGGGLSIGTYHGPDRAKEMPPEKMQMYDVVLTTYQVLEQDFRKMVSPNKVKCPNCGGKFKIDKLRIHLKYFCGEAAQRTEAQARQRRTATRPGRGATGGGGGGRNSKSSKGKKDTKKKPPMTKTASKTTNKKTAGSSRKVVRIRGSSGYDSDSELSVESPSAGGDMIPSTRPSRSAAKAASKRLSSSVKEWGSGFPDKQGRGDDGGDDGDSSFESSIEAISSDDESDASSEDYVLSELPKRKKKAAPKQDSEDEALERAREKQRRALENASRNKKSMSSKGKKQAKGKAEPKKAAKGKGKKGKKKFDDEDPSSGDESGSDDDGDPIDDIDLDALMDEAMAGSRFSVLHSFCWWRVVLDEAHFIKSRSSQTSAAAFSLTSIHRWCLSGTPLQNRVGELYSLIRFLRIDPMAHYFCRQKGCDCKSIHYRMAGGKCQGCGHRAFSHYAYFNRHVLNPIQRDGYTGDGRRAMFKLKQEILDKCLLRRTKETKAEDMNLPPRVVTIRPVRLHPVEEDFYNALYTQTKSSFDDYVASGTLLNNYAHIFDLLTKMRQAVDHPYLIVYSKQALERQRQSKQGAPQIANGSADCDMCHEPPTDRVVSSCCGAGFCRGCVIEYLTGAVGDNTPCPSCRAPFTIDLNQASSSVDDDGTLAIPLSPPASRGSAAAAAAAAAIPSLKSLPHVSTGSILRRINLAEFATSTKIEVLIQELIEMRKKRPGSKALVFSQFVNMLDLVRWRLHSDPLLSELGLGFRILHGGMDVKSRDAALKDFREDSNCRVLLMSLKAAGVALNLTVASECFLLDLWWNPAAEMQAIDRTHRLGQHRVIRAVRFVAEGTVEERVLQLQEKKRLVFDGTIGRDAGSLKMLTVDDMVSLFA